MEVNFVQVTPFYVPSVKMAVLYIGLNALIALILALNVSRVRIKSGVYFGEGENAPLQRAARAHANNIEYVPLVLLTIVGVALLGAPLWLVHVLGIALTVGRILHGIGLNMSSGASVGRGGGILLTWVALLVGAIACIVYGLAALPTLPPAVP